MPHRVANFLRTSSSSHANKKKAVVPAAPPSASAPASSRNSSRAASPYASDSDDHHHVAKLADPLADALRRHHRLSLPFSRLSSSAKDHHGHGHHRHASGSSAAASAVALDWSIESPPIVFHGSPDESTGALVSGQMVMDVREDCVEVDCFTATLSLHVNQKRPFQGHCGDCQRQVTELKSWRLLAHPTTTPLRRGRHLFPFSALLEGSLPASMDTSVAAIDYVFRAEAILVRAGGTSCASARFARTLDVKRALPEPLYPHHSVRVFPPTNIKASAHYCSVIHPTGSNQLTLKLDGLMSRNDKTRTLDLWRLKKVTWRLEETVKVLAPACQRHAPPADGDGGGGGGGGSSSGSGTGSGSGNVYGNNSNGNGNGIGSGSGSINSNSGGNDNGDDNDDDGDDDDTNGDANAAGAPKRGSRKRLLRVETRALGEKQLHDGWKSDFSGCDGTVDMEFCFGVNQYRSHSRDAKYACDTKTRDGTEVTHSLLIELIVSKEYAPEGKPHLATQTGTGRILRMHFAVVLTEFPGLGVSWDNEAPPVYQDVPPSPPGYPCDECRRPPPVEYEHLEALDARRPPSGGGGSRGTPVLALSSPPSPPLSSERPREESAHV